MTETTLHTKIDFLSDFLFEEERGYGFAVADNYHLINEVNDNILSEGEQFGKTIKMVNLVKNDDRPLPAILQQNAADADALIVKNIPILFNTDDIEGLQAFNIAREAINALNLTILFWVDQKTNQFLFNFAADLYSQRSLSTLYFNETVTAPISRNSILTDTTRALTKEEQQYKQSRIALLLKQIEKAKNANDQKLLFDLVINLGLEYRTKGDIQKLKALIEQYDDQIAHYIKIAKDKELLYEKAELNTIINLSNLFKELGEYKFAKIILEKAAKSADDESINNVIANDLALVLHVLGDYEGAKKMLEIAMRSDEQNFGESHPTTAIRYSNLAIVLKDLGEYEKTKELLEKTKLSMEQNFGVDHPKTAQSYSNLALIVKALGDFEEAKKLLEKAVQIDEQNFGENHPTTAIRYSNLATVLQALSDYKEAKKMLEKALIILHNHLGDKHPNTKNIKGNLEYVVQLMNAKT